MTKPIQTPPTHPETEKLIAELHERFSPMLERYTAGYPTQFQKDAMLEKFESWLRTALTTSFASGRAQGAKEEKERIKQGIEEAEPLIINPPDGYYKAVSDYKSNLLQMVEGK